MTHALVGLRSSNSSIVAAVGDESSYSSTRWLCSAICDKVFECTEHSADRNSSLAVPGLRPHTARRSTHLLQEFGWEVFNYHPLHSPNLKASDLHFFLYLKKFLFGQRQRFQNDKEAELSVTVIPNLGGRLLRHRIQKLVPWYDKCLHSGGWICWKIAQNLLYLFQ